MIMRFDPQPTHWLDVLPPTAETVE
jgi:hypothetical protein